MMRNSFWCISLLGTGLLAGAAVLHAVAQPGGPGHTIRIGLHRLHALHGSQQGQCDVKAVVHAHMAQLHAELNLTDAQRDAVHSTFQARHVEIAAAVRPVLEAKRTLINAVHADAPDDVVIRAAGETLGRSVGEAAVVLARVKTEILQNVALTPEQTRKLGELKTNFDASIGRLLDLLGPPAENPR